MRNAALFLVLGLMASAGTAAPRAKPPKEPPPLVRLPSPPADEQRSAAEPRVIATYQDWRVGQAEPFTFAFTTNPGESEFGLICEEACVFYLDVQLSCETGEIYPAIISSRLGSDTVRLRCTPVDGAPLLTASPTRALIEAVRAGGEIGFAVPLESGRFDVARFSLAGGVEALLRLRDLANVGRDADQGLRDATT